MEVKIGVQNATRELILDSDEALDAIEGRIADAVESGGLLSLVDTKGRRTVVPGDKLAYVELGGSTVGAVGFRS